MRVAHRSLAVIISVTAMAGVGMSTASVASAAPTKTYTATQVKTHHTTTNCWVVIKGGVYNLTAFKKGHSGGEAAILPLCGKDGTKVFVGQHASTAAVKLATLSKYKVGLLKK